MSAVTAIRPHAGFGPLAKALGATALVIFTAILTYMFTAHLNVETAIQQQQTSALQQFEQSGAQMDASLSVFVDALLDQKGVAEARTAARTSIILHSSQSSPLSSLAGTGNVEQYVNALGELRSLTDATDGRMTARKMAQQHVNIMAYRVKLVAICRERIYQ